MRGDDGHRRFETMAVAHVLGGLDSDEGRVFRSHLLECQLCRARVGELRAIASDLAGVERDERRERSANAVETKRRQEAEAKEEQSSRRRMPSRWLLLGLAVALAGVASYTIVLRGNLQRLEEAYGQLREVSAALEHGEDLEVLYAAPDVEATAKVRGEQLVLLLEGLADDQTYVYYLLDDAAGSDTGEARGPLAVASGRVLQSLTVPAGTDRLVVTAPQGAWGARPDAERVLEVLVHEPVEEPASIGSA